MASSTSAGTSLHKSYLIAHCSISFFFSQIFPFVIDKPKIVEGSCRKVENRLECTCQIQSFPEPNLKWIHNGVFYNNSNHTNAKVNIFTQTSNSVTNSTMTLPVNAEENQNIQCVASNLHGELVREIFNETGKDLTNSCSMVDLIN